MSARDLDRPMLSADDCVWSNDGWEEAFEGSVRDARTCSRGRAAAFFAGEMGGDLTEVRVWKRYVRLYSLRDSWLEQGQDRWSDDWLYENGVTPKWDDIAECWTYVGRDGSVVEPPRPPDEPPSSWAPRESDWGWQFTHRSHPAAVPVWVCAPADHAPPPKPNRREECEL